jgi:hypothetical protein
VPPKAIILEKEKPEIKLKIIIIFKSAITLTDTSMKVTK